MDYLSRNNRIANFVKSKRKNLNREQNEGYPIYLILYKIFKNIQRFKNPP